MFFCNLAAFPRGTLYRNLPKDLSGRAYWSGTVLEPSPNSEAWAFNAGIGLQTFGGQENQFFAWAVRDGDVAAPSSVPEPASLALPSSTVNAAST
jgi:hypothetical protein